MLKNIYRPLLAVCALLGLPGGVRGQANFRPGYVVSAGGDTLRGAVDYGSGRRSAYECRFKAS